jgi:hypothetical protein
MYLASSKKLGIFVTFSEYLKFIKRKTFWETFNKTNFPPCAAEGGV